MTGRLARLTGVAALLAATLSCEVLTRTNPYDPGTKFDYVIAGPDTLFSIGQTAKYTILSTPALSDTAGQWVCDCVDLAGGQAGNFVVTGLTGPPLWPATETVTVRAFIGVFDSALGPGETHGIFDRRELTRTVALTQRLVSILLRCPDTHACASLSAGSTWTIWTDGFDALGNQIYGLTSFSTTNPLTGTPIATFVSRDTTIASVSPVGIRVATVTAVNTGSTWIVATRDQLRDSLLVTVK